LLEAKLSKFSKHETFEKCLKVKEIKIGK